MNIHSSPNRSIHPSASAIDTLSLLSTLGTAQAAIVDESRQDAGQYAELEQLAQASLKANAADAEANASLFMALTFVDPSDAKRLEAGAKQATLCVEQQPSAAVCHLALSHNLSMQMLNVGMVNTMRMAGSQKEGEHK